MTKPSLEKIIAIGKSMRDGTITIEFRHGYLAMVKVARKKPEKVVKGWTKEEEEDLVEIDKINRQNFKKYLIG